MKYEAKPGINFDINDVKVIKEKTRFIIATVMLITAVSFLLGSVVYGVTVNDFSLLRTVWGVVAVPLGMVLQHYFT